MGETELADDVLAYVSEVEARADKATPGPWEIERDFTLEDDDDDVVGYPETIGPMRHIEFESALIGNGEQTEADAQFVSHVRTDVPALCRIVQVQEAKFPRCQAVDECTNAASCFVFRAEGDDVYAFSCDEHCGHGNEDMHCESIAMFAKTLIEERNAIQRNAASLKAAIRRITIDIDDGNTPNGPTEEAIDGLQKSLSLENFHLRGAQSAFREANGWGAKLCEAIAFDTKELREAADAYFGEDFAKP